MLRRDGRAARGRRVDDDAPCGRWQTSPCIAALRVTGLTAPGGFDGASDGPSCLAYIEPILVPTLHPGDLVIADHLSAHNVAGVRRAIEAVGASLAYWPPYSPDLNPIDLGATVAFAQMELGVMQGTVTDDAGKPLEGATVRLRDLERGRETSFKSDKNGRFYRRGLQAVEYEMVVEKDGYHPVKDKVKLVAGTDRRFDFKLVKAAPEGAEEFGKGVAAFNKGDNAAAAQAFEAAVRKAPDLPEVRVNLALAYLRLARTADAVAQLETAAALGPNDARVQFQLGGAYVEMQALDKAAAAFEAGLAKQPDLGDPLAYEAAVTLGAVYFAKGQNDTATAQFEKALASRPGAAAPSLGLAKVHFSKGEVNQALTLFDRIVAMHPGTPEATQAATFIKELRKGRGLAAPTADGAHNLAVDAKGNLFITEAYEGKRVQKFTYRGLGPATTPLLQ